MTIGEFDKNIGPPYEIIEVKDASNKYGFSWYGNNIYIDVFAMSNDEKSKRTEAVVEIGKDVELKY